MSPSGRTPVAVRAGPRGRPDWFTLPSGRAHVAVGTGSSPFLQELHPGNARSDRRRILQGFPHRRPLRPRGRTHRRAEPGPGRRPADAHPARAAHFAFRACTFCRMRDPAGVRSSLYVPDVHFLQDAGPGGGWTAGRDPEEDGPPVGTADGPPVAARDHRPPPPAGTPAGTTAGRDLARRMDHRPPPPAGTTTRHRLGPPARLPGPTCVTRYRDATRPGDGIPRPHRQTALSCPGRPPSRSAPPPVGRRSRAVPRSARRG